MTHTGSGNLCKHDFTISCHLHTKQHKSCINIQITEKKNKNRLPNLLPRLIYCKEENFCKQRGQRRVMTDLLSGSGAEHYLYPPSPAPSPVEEEEAVG